MLLRKTLFLVIPILILINTEINQGYAYKAMGKSVSHVCIGKERHKNVSLFRLFFYDTLRHIDEVEDKITQLFWKYVAASNQAHILDEKGQVNGIRFMLTVISKEKLSLLLKKDVPNIFLVIYSAAYISGMHTNYFVLSLALFLSHMLYVGCRTKKIR